MRETLFLNIGKGRTFIPVLPLGNYTHRNVSKREFDPYLWQRSPVQEVATLPCGIDSVAVYILTNVPAGNEQQAALSSDERK